MMNQRITGFSSKRGTRILKIHTRIFLIGIITLCLFTVHATSLPMVAYPLKPSPETGPYQDEEFLELANEIIYGLSNQTLPNGVEMLDILTMQQKLSQMSISPQLYPNAKKINAYLYYTAKAGTDYSDALNFYSKPYSPVYMDESQISGAKQYQAAAQIIWNQIKDLYPGVIPYRLEYTSKPFSTNENPDYKWPPYSPFSPSPTTGGLW